MSRKLSSQVQTGCSGPERHADHLCVLVEAGRTSLVRELSGAPAYYCLNCGLRANRAENLCRPEKLEDEI